MDRTTDVAAKRRELVVVANSMLESNTNLIEGVRQICVLRLNVGDSDNDVFMTMRAVESETDAFPLGAMRAKCSPDFLERMDVEMQAYLSDARDDILQACRDIVRTYS
jgi:hypothetical protein